MRRYLRLLSAAVDPRRLTIPPSEPSARGAGFRHQAPPRAWPPARPSVRVRRGRGKTDTRRPTAHFRGSTTRSANNATRRAHANALRSAALCLLCAASRRERRQRRDIADGALALVLFFALDPIDQRGLGRRRCNFCSAAAGAGVQAVFDAFASMQARAPGGWLELASLARLGACSAGGAKDLAPWAAEEPANRIDRRTSTAPP